MEHLETREFFRVHRTNILNVSAGTGYEILREWIRRLYNNVIDRLCVPTSQSVNDPREQMSGLDTS